MGNSSSSSSTTPSSRPPRSPPRPASPPPPPMPRRDAAAAALAIDTPKHDTTTGAGAGAAPLPAAIGLSPPLSISPPRPMAGAGASPPSSLRATPGGFGRGGSPVPPSPRSAASRASTVTSAAEREAQSYFWSRMKDQYQERKTARRQSQLGTAGKLGRPCCLALHSVSLRGAIPPGAQVHIEVAVAPGEHESHNSPLASFSPVSSLATPPRQPVAHGNVDTQGRVDHVLIPSVTATSSLVLAVVVTRRLEEEEEDGSSHDVDKQQPPQTQTIATLRYPLADVTATLRPTELRLTPESHGEHVTAPRARSPSALLLSPFGGGRRRSESPTPTPARASPPPTAAGGAGAETAAAGAAAGLGALPTLGAVWGELTFFDNRTSGVGWVELAEELGKPIHQRRLLLVTPQALALLDGPAPKLGCPGYPLVHVSHVEPGRSPLLARQREAHEDEEIISTAGAVRGASGGFVTVTLSRAEVKAAPGSGYDVVLVVGGEEEAKRWTQVLRRAAHEASFGGDDS